MKALILLLTFLLPLRLFAITYDRNCECREDTTWTLDVRGAYYQPSSKAVRKIYSSGWMDYQVEASYRIHDFFEIFGGVNWASKQHGHIQPLSYGFKNQTKMYILPLSLGAKFIYPILPCVEIYLGAGVCYSFLKIHNHCKEEYYYWGLSRAPFKKNIYKSNEGAVFKVGLQFDLGDRVFLDLVVDYFSQRFRFSHHEDLTRRCIFKHYVDCSGFKYAAGLGVYF